LRGVIGVHRMVHNIMSELLNCAICGALAQLKINSFVRCSNLNCSVMGPSQDPHGEKWNDLMRRAAAAPTQESPAPKRKIVQIVCDSDGYLQGLDNVGAVWEIKYGKTLFWKPVIGPDLPLIGPDLPGDAP
jgi:hypothetical protein